MRIACVPIAATISSRGEAGLTPRMHRHVEACERCQGDLSDQRRLMEGLHGLRDETFAAPGEILPRVMADIGPWAVPDAHGRRDRWVPVAAAAVATAMATAAAGTAVALRIYRQRAA